jgi:hypothetical protein
MPRLVPTLVSAIALSSIVIGAGLSAADEAPVSSNGTYYSQKEVSRLFKEAQAAKAAKEVENPLLAPKPEEPVVDLEPMTVTSDDATLLMQIRRRIELGPESVQRRLAELSPMLARDAAYDARAADRFFTEDPNIGPADAGSPARVDFVPILKSATKAIKEASQE